MVGKLWRRWFKHFLMPCRWRIRFNLLRIHYADPTIVQKPRGHTNRVTQIIQVGWIRDLALDDDTLRSCLQRAESGRTLSFDELRKIAIGEWENGALLPVRFPQ